MNILKMLCRGGGSTPPSISYRTSAASATDLTEYTFSAQDIGTAGSNRHVIVGILGSSVSGSASSIVSCTIGGVSATTARTQANVDGEFAGLVIAAVPTGATGDVVVTMNTDQSQMAVGVWAAYDLTSITKVTSAVSTADPAALNLNTQIGDVIVAIERDSNGAATAWTGVTERFDAASETMRYSGGDHTATTAETPRTISGDVDGTGISGVSATWR